MHRRDYLGVVTGVTVAGASGGCLGAADDNPDVALPEPDRQFDSADVPYPAWGERVPDVTVPAALAGDDVSLRSVGTPALVTFFYSYCQTVCPVLVATLRNVQTHAAEEGYGDAVTFLPTTFDPGRDDATRLEQYAGEHNVALDAGNWQFLRPASRSRAKTVVQEEFGVTFERTHPEEMDRYMFAHGALTLLVNADGYVERAYRTKTPDSGTIVADLRTVREA